LLRAFLRGIRLRIARRLCLLARLLLLLLLGRLFWLFHRRHPYPKKAPAINAGAFSHFRNAKLT
jgi:hypothetical protein